MSKITVECSSGGGMFLNTRSTCFLNDKPLDICASNTSYMLQRPIVFFDVYFDLRSQRVYTAASFTTVIEIKFTIRFIIIYVPIASEWKKKKKQCYIQRNTLVLREKICYLIEIDSKC